MKGTNLHDELRDGENEPCQGSLDVHALECGGVEDSAASSNLLSRSSPLHHPHGRIVYLDTIIIELLGGGRIASKPYSAASGHHIMLLQGDRMWKVTRSKRESQFYTALADDVTAPVGCSTHTSTHGVNTCASTAVKKEAGREALGANSFSSPSAAERHDAARLLAPFVPHSYGIRKVRRLRVGSYEFGEEMVLSKEELQRLVAATRAMNAKHETAARTPTAAESRERGSLLSPATLSPPSTPIIAVATFSPVSERAPHAFRSTPRGPEDSFEHDDNNGSGSATALSLTHPLACQTCPLIAEQPEVLQSIVEQFDRDMEDVWLRYYKYVPPAVPTTDASPPTGVHHNVEGSPNTRVPAPPQEHGGNGDAKMRAEGDVDDSICRTPSPVPLAFSFVLSGAGGPPATAPHVVMEDQLNSHLPASGPPERSYVEMIVLEDCCHNLHYPCTMDIKMGTRQYGLRASAEKMKSKNKKAKVSTTGAYGIRIDGVRRWSVTHNVYETQDKKFFRHFDIDQVKDAVHAFLTPHDPSQAAAMRAKMFSQCEALLRAFEQQSVYHFYTSSLLFLYDALRPVETCRIVMVDFAYTYRTDELVEAEGLEAMPAGGHDTSYMTGLRSLLQVLQSPSSVDTEQSES